MSAGHRLAPVSSRPTGLARSLALVLVLGAALLAVFIHLASGDSPTPVAGPGTITFDHAQILDPVRLVGEPDIAIDSQGSLFASGPGSSPTQSSHFWKSEDSGTQWHYVGIIPEEKSNGGLGGGDTELQVDKNNTIWGMDQEGLACNAHFHSTDGGKVWTYTQGCDVGTDRPWMATYRDPNTGLITAYFVANGEGIGCYLLESTDDILWTPADRTTTSPTVVIGPGGSCIGRPAIDPRNGTIYVPTGSGVRKSTNGGVTWTTVAQTGAQGGAGTGSFGTIVSDAEGNLYQSWTNLSTVFLSVSKNAGVTWTRYSIPNPFGLKREIFPWPVVGDPGRVGIAYYGTTDDPSSLTGLWRTYMTFSTNALSGAATFTTVIADEHPMKTGTVCLQGTTCVLNATDPAAGDRTLADFFMLDVDRRDGRVYLIYNDDGENSPTTHVGLAYVGVLRERTGPSLLASVGNVQPPTTSPVSIASANVLSGRLNANGNSGLPPGNWTTDPVGDAVYPYAPVTGPDVPAMDIREASVADDGTSLTFKINLADLTDTAQQSALDVVGAPSWVVTWWVNRPDVAAPNSQARYFVKWLGGTNFVYGQTGTVELPQLGAPAPKFVTYVPAGTATGSVDGNEVSISVPATAVGNPRTGDKLDEITAWTWSERGEIPTVVDAAKSFSYRFGTSAAKQHAPDGYVELSVDDSAFGSPTRVTPSDDGTWSADIGEPALAGHHTLYARQVLSSDLYVPSWPDVQAGSVVQTTFLGHVPKISVGGASVPEGTAQDSTMNFKVSLSEPSTDDVTVKYATTQGTALSPDDFAAAAGTVTIPAGQTSALVPVTVHGDSEPEPNETFSLDLSAPANATIADGHAVGTIVNDDGALNCTITGTEGNDVLTGTNGNDVICGLGGNDTIHGNGGNDIVVGGAGNDTLYGDAGSDVLRGQEGGDLLNGGSGDDTVIGFTGKDTLVGADGRDSLNAKDGVADDSLDGGTGTDTCAADPGDVVKSCP